MSGIQQAIMAAGAGPATASFTITCGNESIIGPGTAQGYYASGSGPAGGTAIGSISGAGDSQGNTITGLYTDTISGNSVLAIVIQSNSPLAANYFQNLHANGATYSGSGSPSVSGSGPFLNKWMYVIAGAASFPGSGNLTPAASTLGP